jgi:hypothetical protein
LTGVVEIGVYAKAAEKQAFFVARLQVPAWLFFLLHRLPGEKAKYRCRCGLKLKTFENWQEEPVTIEPP